jgi:signal transduction histidine kinase
VLSRDASEEPGVVFSVDEVVHASLKLIGLQMRSHNIAMVMDLSKGLPSVFGHPHQVEQVLLNLLGNARDAVDEKAEQVLSGEYEKRVQVTTRVVEDNNETWVELAVTDNGIGISIENLSRVFEPFFTTKTAERGTGLGLSISYAIVQNQGGRLVCESQLGEGSVFRILLPVSKGPDLES